MLGADCTIHQHSLAVFRHCLMRVGVHMSGCHWQMLANHLFMSDCDVASSLK